MEFNVDDFKNLLVFLSRAPINGLAEAEVAVVLAVKLRAKIQPPPPVAEAEATKAE